VRRQGYAVVDQELEQGIRSVAVPVRNARGTVIAAINVSAHASRVTVVHLRQQFRARLMVTATAIENDLAATRR